MALHRSGAAYVEVALPPSGHLHVRVESADPNTHASVLLFGGYPTLCQAPVTVPLSGGSGEALVGTGSGCDKAALVLVNRAAPYERPRGLLARFRSAGTPTTVDWTILLAGEPDDEIEAVAAHDQHVYVAGRTSPGRIVVGEHETGMTAHGGFVARRRPDGRWAFLATATAIRPKVLVADTGGAYVMGSFTGTARFSPSIELGPVNGQWGFVARLDRDGQWQWARATSMLPSAAARAADGMVWLAGWFEGLLSHDGVVVDGETYGGQGAALLLALHADGTFAGSAHVGARFNHASFRSLTFSPDGRLFAAGVHGGRQSQGNRVIVNGHELPAGSDCCIYRLSGMVVEADPGLVLADASGQGHADPERQAPADPDPFRWGLSALGDRYELCYSQASAGSIAFDDASGRLLVSGSMRCGTYLLGRDGAVRADLRADPFWGTSAFLATIDPDGDTDPAGQPWGMWERTQRLTTGDNAGTGAGCPCALFAPPLLAAGSDGSVYGAAAVESRVKLPVPLTFGNTYADGWDTEVVGFEAHVGEEVLEIAWMDHPWSSETVDRPQAVALTTDSIWIGGSLSAHRLAAGDRFMDTPLWYRVRLGGPVHRGPARTSRDAFLLERPRTPPPDGQE